MTAATHTARTAGQHRLRAARLPPAIALPVIAVLSVLAWLLFGTALFLLGRLAGLV